METEKAKDLDWSEYAIADALDMGGKEVLARVESSPLPEDDDVAAAKKDYEEGPQTQVGDLSNYEYFVINAALSDDEDAILTTISNFLFNSDVASSFKEQRLAEEDAWKDKPIGSFVSAPIASALKFGKEGMNVSWVTRLMWLIVVLVLNWMAWAIIG